MQRSDVIILGGGMVGLTLAAALDSSGLSSIIIDPADPALRATAEFDGRTSAVSSSSMRMLEVIGIAPFLVAPGCPIRRIAVADGLEPGALHFDAERLGWTDTRVSQGPYAIFDFQESKTVWHPMGM